MFIHLSDTERRDDFPHKIINKISRTLPERKDDSPQKKYQGSYQKGRMTSSPNII